MADRTTNLRLHMWTFHDYAIILYMHAHYQVAYNVSWHKKIYII